MNYSCPFVCVFVLLFTGLSSGQSNLQKESSFLSRSNQLSDTVRLKHIEQSRLKDKDSTGFAFPLQAGFEFGRGNVTHNSGTDYFTIWNAFLDINLYLKEIFLTVELGDGLVEKDWTIRPGYLSIGVKYRALNENRHNVFIHGAVLPGPYGIPGGYTVTAKYMYALNDFIGISVCGRYTNWLYKTESGFGIFGGIQIITN